MNELDLLDRFMVFVRNEPHVFVVGVIAIVAIGIGILNAVSIEGKGDM